MKRIDVAGLLRYLVTHPKDLPVVLLAGWRLRQRTWWRTRPFLPLPAKDYWAFRVTTALGFNDATMSVGDVIHAARWSRQQRVGR